jgi:hypothetical protein
VKAPAKIVPPPAIISQRDWLIGRPDFGPEWQPILNRLCKNKVWRQLGKRSPAIARPQLIELWSRWHQGEEPDEKWSDQDIALQVVLLEAFFLLLLDARTITDADAKKLVAASWHEAVRLRAEAAIIKEHTGEAYAKDLEVAAEWAELDSLYEPWLDDVDPRLRVRRHQGPPRVRPYCILLSDVTRLLYGDVLRRTVAAIATAALDHRVSPANIRYWV